MNLWMSWMSVLDKKRKHPEKHKKQQIMNVVVFLFFYALCVFYVAFCLRLFTLFYVPFVLFVLRY